MSRSFNRTHTSRSTPRPASLDAVRLQMAEALIGRTVELVANATTIARGVVTGVLAEPGIPKLVVGGSRYELNQILTVVPPSLAH